MEISSVIKFEASLVDVDYDVYFRHSSESWYIYDEHTLERLIDENARDLEAAYQAYINEDS